MKRKDTTQPQVNKTDYFIAHPNEIRIITIQQARRDKKRRENEINDFIKQSTQ